MDNYSGEDCSICGKPITDEPAFGLPDGTPNLIRFFDYMETFVHLNCFQNWEHRLELSRLVFEGRLRLYQITRGAIGYILAREERWAVVCGPKGTQPWEVDTPVYASVLFRDWSFRLYAYWHEWEQVLETGYHWLTDFAYSDVEKIVEEVKLLVPNTAILQKMLDKQTLQH